LSAQLKVDTRVRWLGWKTPPDPYYALADLFVCPSREEPLGNVILEAWNYALPVVSTATAGARELATDGLDALLCRAGDPDGLASAVAAAFSQPVAERVALGQAGRRLLAERYSRKAIVEAYIDLYGRLLVERGHA
jgi:glycosyltransferase involved in cell wall biosynthesis